MPDRDLDARQLLVAPLRAELQHAHTSLAVRTAIHVSFTLVPRLMYPPSSTGEPLLSHRFSTSRLVRPAMIALVRLVRQPLRRLQGAFLTHRPILQPGV